MRRPHLFAMRLLMLLFLSTGAAGARADTPLALWKSFDGRVNFTGTQVTVRTAPNASSPCTVEGPTSIRTANLKLPATAVVISAQLYWAGSGIPDSTVTFQGNEVTATRRFTSTTTGNGFDYFGGAADVTQFVKTGGDYNFSGLTVANGAPWCGSRRVLGGFSLVVVYTLSSEPQRVLNIYEGFQHIKNEGVVVNATNFRWSRTAQVVLEKARVGHITWGGDRDLAQGGESLTFEGEALVDTNNRAGNQFNSFSNVNNDGNSHGVDFDVYDPDVKISNGSDAVVSTGYYPGQDMLLLNAEILLIPTLQVSDLAIKISRAGALKINTDVEYTVTVTNNGPVTETGAITVKNTLPPGMYYVSGVVTGWSCTATQVAGTCIYRAGLAPGATAPVLTVRARVTSLGDKTNKVEVTGTTSDDNQANNAASDIGVATNADGTTETPPPPPSFIFTDSECKADVAIGVTGQPCKRYTASTVGGTATRIWLTATNAKGVPAAANGKDDLTPSFEFMLECNNPATGTVSATYAGVDVPVCAPQGQLAKWSNAVKIKFPAKTVSIQQSLIYNDVGRIRLNLRESSGSAATEVFVSAPLRIDFKRISNGTHDNPGNIGNGGSAFAQAGAPLSVELGAVLGGAGGFAPNFGRERLTPIIVLDKSTAVAGLASQGAIEEKTELRTWTGGILATKASWSEVGAVNFTVRADDPELTGAGAMNRYQGVAIGGSTAPVGRFYPAYFITEAAGPFDCPASLAKTDFPCLRKEKGAVFSGQAFDVTVHAYGLGGARLQNFPGAWSREITLQAVGSAGAMAPLPVNFTPPAPAKATTIAAGVNVGKALYTLAVPFDRDTPRSSKVTPPTTIYVRAVASDTTLAGNVDITSRRIGEVSNEGDIVVLSGRMNVPNALGTDLLRTPLRLRAEYWAGPKAGWLFQPGFVDSPGPEATLAVMRECTRGLSLTNSVKPTPCNASAGVSTLDKDKFVPMSKGEGVLWLRPPGKLANGVARAGAITLGYDGWAWLPSTIGRVTFGSHRSPVIYVREMYF